MKIGLISDTHNQQHKVKTALNAFREAGVEVVLHAGDVTSVETLALFEGFDVWVARGNMDRDHRLAGAVRDRFGPGRLRNVHELEIDGARVALTHGDSHQALHSLLESGEYDYVIRGHTHARNDETRGETRLINPGALKHTEWRPTTAAILNLATGDLTWVEV
jgi:hypothetical protein